MAEDNRPVRNYYETLYDEDAREERNPLEFIRSKEIISRYIQADNMVIADICGASGAYSYWLAGQGHAVHLLDLTPKHITQAREKGEKLGLPLASLTVGDARSLPFANENFDMTLLMGALYHLQNPQDRALCLEETHRVLKPGGTAVMAYISRYASLIDGLQRGFINDPEFVRILDGDLATGRHDNPSGHERYFTAAFFHTPELIRQELIQAGFQNIVLYAVEGIAGAFKAEVDMDILLKYIRLTETAPELLGVSSHILAVCQK